MGAELDERFDTAEKWRDEAIALRAILLDTGLTETRKWGKPCYGTDAGNIAIIQRMNDFLALMFFKGALLADPGGLLCSQGENSHSALRVELTGVDEVRSHEAAIRALVAEAIRVEEAGLKVERPEHVFCDELLAALAADAELKAAFEALTPGRQRGYDLYFAGAKQSATRKSRIEKHRERILAGKGFRDA